MAGVAAWPKPAVEPPPPPRGVPFFGRRPGWDAAREHQREGRCGECGGLLHDPIRLHDNKIEICMGCMRAPAGVPLSGHRHVADPRRPAGRAARVKGKPDPRLNAYLPPPEPRPKPKPKGKPRPKPRAKAEQ